MIVTFVLFRMTTGDPTAVLLGKKSTPQDIEQMRDMLGAGKPLFFGNWVQTELYSTADFSGGRSEFPGIALENCEPNQVGLILNHNSRLLLARQFDASGPILMRFQCSPSKKKLIINGNAISNGEMRFEVPPDSIEITTQDDNVLLASVSFKKRNTHFFNSQLADSFRELVSFQRGFPYVSFFNFGNTLLTNEPIKDKLIRGMIPSLSIMLPVFIGELLVGIALALISCAFRDTILDRSIVVLSVTGMSISYLVLIVLGQWYLAYYLNLFPVWGWDSPKCLALPVLLGIISGTGSGVRFYRTVFIDEIRKEYLRTALAKGVSSYRLYGVHLLRNALIPILTRASTVLPFLFTGSLLLESFFGIPGLGYESVNALNNSDIGMLKALVMLGAVLFIGVNLITDLLYAWVDPRIRME